MPDVLAGLDPEQRLVAQAVSGPVVVLAGAGTGKTRAITHRIAHAVLSGAHPARTGMAVTFTTRAAGEMRQRLVQLGVPAVGVRTFHAAALSQLRYFWPTVVGGEFPTLVASKYSLVGQAAKASGITPAKAIVRDLAAEIEWAGSTMTGAGDYPRAAQEAGRAPVGSGSERIDHAGIAQVMTRYQSLKESTHTIDFEDVLLCLVAMLGERPDVADEVRRIYRWFTVDEYQDVTPAQEALLGLWLGDRDDVCVVGDPSQTIYSFAGADPRALDRFARRWPNATEVRLDRCYRCTPQIVAVANSVIRAGARSEGRREPGPAADPLLLRSQRDAGPTPDQVTCADDADEAATVARRISDLLEAGTPARDIAVLMRTNAASEPVEVAFAEAGIPYVMRGGERFFERAEVREAIARLRGQAAAASAGSEAPELPVDLSEQVRAVLAGMGWQASGPTGGGAARERWESLAAVAALADESSAAGLGELVGELERRAQLAHAPTPDGVTIATLHAAKGLEWPAVFVIGCAEGNLPIVYADTDERVDEERRLFYVGMTRARDRLTVSWALSRGRSGRHREPSRFLAEMRSRAKVEATGMPAGLVRQGRSMGRKERRRRQPGRCRVCGAGLVTAPERTLGRCATCPGHPDEALAEQLRTWRSATSRERGVPAYVVFTDVTLAALAELKPATREALLDIPGIGPAKADLYGEVLLEMIAAAVAAGQDQAAESPQSPSGELSGPGPGVDLTDAARSAQRRPPDEQDGGPVLRLP